MSTKSVILDKLLTGQELSASEAYAFQTAVLAGQVDTETLVAVFQAMSERIASEAELLGFLQASREVMLGFDPENLVLDTCSTGGDGINVFNVSTLAAIVCASGGVMVAKHGNKSASSVVGSFDLLEAIGVNLPSDPQTAKEQLKTNGLVFLFAPKFNPAFKWAKEARVKFGRKTYFNFLGPLVNPAKPAYQVIGVSEVKMVEPMGQALLKTGSQKVWLLQAQNGLNEISPVGLTRVWEFVQGSDQVNEFLINPEEYGIFSTTLEDILVNNLEQAKQIFWNVLQNRANPSQMATVVLNAAAGFCVAGKVNNFLDGVLLAKELLVSGQALYKLQQVLLFQ